MGAAITSGCDGHGMGIEQCEFDSVCHQNGAPSEIIGTLPGRSGSSSLDVGGNYCSTRGLGGVGGPHQAGAMMVPGTPIEVWSSSTQKWIPAVIGHASDSNPAPSVGDVLCEVRDAQGGIQGSKWVRAEDASTMIRLRRDQSQPAGPRGNALYNPAGIESSHASGCGAGRQHQLGADAVNVDYSILGMPGPPGSGAMVHRGLSHDHEAHHAFESGRANAAAQRQQRHWEQGPNHGFRPHSSGSNPALTDTVYPNDRHPEATLYPEQLPVDAEPRSLLAAGSQVEVWRTSDKMWVHATVASEQLMRESRSPAAGAVLCLYDCNKLQKWVRAEDSLTLIRPRRFNNQPTHGSHATLPPNHASHHTVLPNGSHHTALTNGSHYTVPGTVVPEGWLGPGSPVNPMAGQRPGSSFGTGGILGLGNSLTAPVPLASAGGRLGPGAPDPYGYATPQTRLPVGYEEEQQYAKPQTRLPVGYEEAYGHGGHGYQMASTRLPPHLMGMQAPRTTPLSVY